jgi:hypothetical protein
MTLKRVVFYNDDLEGEYWATYSDFHGYRISNMGRIKEVSKNRVFIQKRKPRSSSNSYRQVSLRKDGVSCVFLVHRLVLMTFIGDCPHGFVACHNNGNWLDNRLDNLRWDSVKGNMRDKKEHGTHNQGEKHWNSKLKNDDIHAIRSIKSYRGLNSKLAKHYNVSEKVIATIRNLEAWVHI